MGHFITTNSATPSALKIEKIIAWSYGIFISDLIQSVQNRLLQAL